MARLYLKLLGSGMATDLLRRGLQTISPQTVVIPLETVPDEILERVLSFCSIREVLAVSFTCWRLSRVANSTLYRHVKLASPKKAIKFFLSVCLHEKLGSLVRRCELELSLHSDLTISLLQRHPLLENNFSMRVLLLLPMKNTYPHRDDVFRNPLTLAATALGKLPHLTHLDLLFPEKEMQTDYNAQLLRNCPFQLGHFHTNLRFDSDMATFLKNQPNLQDFRFYSSTPFSLLDMSVLSKDMLLRLSSLSWSNKVPMELVRWLIKGRPIETANIFLLGGGDDISEFLAIGPASHDIKKANLTFEDYRYPMHSQMETINIQFPNLVALGFNMVSLNKGVVSHLYRVLKDFKHLERLFLCDRTHELLLTQAAALTQAKAFWSQCNSLRRIGFYVCNPFVIVDLVTTDSEAGKRKWVVRSS